MKSITYTSAHRWAAAHRQAATKVGGAMPGAGPVLQPGADGPGATRLPTEHSDFNVPALHQFTYILLQVNDRHLKTACHISNDKIKPASTVSHLLTVLKARCHCPHSSGAVRSPAGGSEPAALMACSDTAVTQKGHSAWSLDEPRPWSSLNPCLREAGHWHDLVQGEIRNQDH